MIPIDVETFLMALETGSFEVIQQYLSRADKEPDFAYMQDGSPATRIMHLLHWLRVDHAKQCNRCQTNGTCPTNERIYQQVTKWAGISVNEKRENKTS